MALIDVSRTITVFQRLCQFAEEFTEEHRPGLVAALTSLFRSDLEEGQEPPDVESMIGGFLRRLRRVLGDVTLSETKLLGAFKENIAFRGLRDKLTLELRLLFGRARTECRNHFERERADAAGFPARLSEDPGALVRQTKLVSWTLRQPDFSLGDPVIPGSTATAESILNIFEPKVQELETATSDAIRRRAKARGKQVMKDQEVMEFRTTYALFINLVKSSFRLAGQADIAKWVSLNQPRRTSAAAPAGPPPDTPAAATSSDTDPPIGAGNPTPPPANSAQG